MQADGLKRSKTGKCGEYCMYEVRESHEGADSTRPCMFVRKC